MSSIKPGVVVVVQVGVGGTGVLVGELVAVSVGVPVGVLVGPPTVGELVGVLVFVRVKVWVGVFERVFVGVEEIVKVGVGVKGKVGFAIVRHPSTVIQAAKSRNGVNHIKRFIFVPPGLFKRFSD